MCGLLAYDNIPESCMFMYSDGIKRQTDKAQNKSMELKGKLIRPRINLYTH